MTVGSLVVNLGLNSNPLIQGLAKARSMVSGFSSGLMKLAGLGTGLAGLFSVGSLGLATNEAFEFVEATSRLSRSLGITGSELAGIRHAADVSGVSP